ncbi:hypothetical protein FS837_004565, partial [Tulasnella sp. UAMH 9824]
WAGIIKRRVYSVRGANALWHQDGNEKLRPWGFYVHGCIDGYSRLIIYLECCSNKRSATVEQLFLDGVSRWGWPSRVRGDFGKENNGIEQQMKTHWGEAHRAYLRGRSIQNVRIERLWRDVRKDSLEIYRRIFLKLEEGQLLDMEDDVQRLCLYRVFQPRIQASLDCTTLAWNSHKIRTAQNKSPLALFTLSRQTAMTHGYWTGDPGDAEDAALDPYYGCDGSEIHGRFESTTEEDPVGSEHDGEMTGEDGAAAGSICEEIERYLDELDLEWEDNNWGIDVYQDAVQVIYQRLIESVDVVG